MFCQTCGCQLPAVAKFCATCGSRIETATAVPTLGSFCVNCGKAIDPSYKFCNYCGHSVTRAQTQEATTPPFIPQPIPPPPVTMDSEKAEFEKYADHYSRLSGDELLRLSVDSSQLVPAAQRALVSEMVRRGLEHQPPAVEERKENQGVGGWLAFFIFTVLVFSPILTAVNLVKEFGEMQQAASTSDAVLGSLLFDIVVSIAVMSFGIYAGIQLLRVKPNAVRMAKRYLIFLFVYHVLAIVLTVVGNVAIPSQAEDIGKTIGPSFRSIIYVLIWYSYLGKSKRVAATYPT